MVTALRKGYLLILCQISRSDCQACMAVSSCSSHWGNKFSKIRNVRKIQPKIPPLYPLSFPSFSQLGAAQKSGRGSDNREQLKNSKAQRGKGKGFRKQFYGLRIISDSLLRRTRTHSHSGLTVPCSESSAHIHRGKSSILNEKIKIKTRRKR